MSELLFYQIAEMMNELTQSELKELILYDQESGEFVWEKCIGRRAKMGDVCGSTNCYGYRVITIYSKRYKAHRLAWLYVYGELPKQHIDHINRVTDDNRISNLREVSRSENMRNCKMRENNISGITGIWWNKDTKKWRAYIGNKLIGRFDNIEEAKKARIDQEKILGYSRNHGKKIFINKKKYERAHKKYRNGTNCYVINDLRE